MKWILITSIAFFMMPGAKWETDFETAQKIAKDKDRCILLNFSGSDWCVPCIRLRKEIFESDDFEKMADDALVLLNADFPRNQKNQLSKEIQVKNEALAERFNSSGQFPLTLLLSPDGKVLRSWEGYPRINAASFINEIKTLADDYHR